MISVELLRRFPLFAGQSFYMLEEIASISEEVEAKKGEWLFRENEEASKFYVILEGKIGLSLYLFVGGEGQHLQAISSLGKGELVGWSSLVKPNVYTLNGQVEEDSRLLVIQAEPLRELLDDNPECGYHLTKRVAEVISERLVYAYIQLLSLADHSSMKPPEKNFSF